MVEETFMSSLTESQKKQGVMRNKGRGKIMRELLKIEEKKSEKLV